MLLTAARFDVEKRHGTLVEATRRLVDEGFDVQVWLAGAGPLKEQVERQVHGLGLEHVIRFLGFVMPEQLLEWLSTGLIDLVVLPSDAEGIPVSLMEALSHGIPAVACDAGGVTELLGDGCGEVVPIGAEHHQQLRSVAGQRRGGRGAPGGAPVGIRRLADRQPALRHGIAVRIHIS